MQETRGVINCCCRGMRRLRLWQRGYLYLCAFGQQIERDLQVGTARAPRTHNAPRVADSFRDLFDVLDDARPARQRLHPAGLVLEFVQFAARSPFRVPGQPAADDEEWNRIGVGAGDGRSHVGHARPGDRANDSGAPGYARVPLGHEASPLLMSREDVAQPWFAAYDIIERERMHAGNAEDRVDAVGTQDRKSTRLNS